MKGQTQNMTCVVENVRYIIIALLFNSSFSTRLFFPKSMKSTICIYGHRAYPLRYLILRRQKRSFLNFYSFVVQYPFVVKHHSFVVCNYGTKLKVI